MTNARRFKGYFARIDFELPMNDCSERHMIEACGS
jgi:hypothetical protein